MQYQNPVFCASAPAEINLKLRAFSEASAACVPMRAMSVGLLHDTQQMVHLSFDMLKGDKEQAERGDEGQAALGQTERMDFVTGASPVDKLASSWDFSSQRRQEFQHKFEVLTRGARRWKLRKSHHAFTPWDFSQIANAAVTLAGGPASAERPGREGVSGSYFIRSTHDILGVFKPIDEESGKRVEHSNSISEVASNVETESYFSPGGGAHREVAAYLLDHDHFAGVPQTALACLDIALPKSDRPALKLASSDADAKNGAFQMYVSNLGDADDFGPAVFLSESVHRLAILDIRIINCDRHGGNALVVRSEQAGISNAYELVPIDHGFVLPEFVPTCRWPVWMDWKQTKEPLGIQTRRYVEMLDAEMDARILKDELDGAIAASSLAWLRVSTFLLKRGIALGLSLHDIGLFMFSRDPGRETSALAKCTAEAFDAGVAREQRLLSMHADLCSLSAMSSPSRPSKVASCIMSTTSKISSGATSSGASSVYAGSEGICLNRSDSNEPIFELDDCGSDASVYDAGERFLVDEMTLQTATRHQPHVQSEVVVHELSEAAWDYVVKYACRLLEQQLQDHADAAAQKCASASQTGARNVCESIARQQSLGRVRSIPDIASVPGARSAASPAMTCSYSTSPLAHMFSPSRMAIQRQNVQAAQRNQQSHPQSRRSDRSDRSESAASRPLRLDDAGRPPYASRHNEKGCLAAQQLDVQALQRSKVEHELRTRYNLPRLDNTLAALFESQPRHADENFTCFDGVSKNAESKMSVSPVSPLEK
eukprot:CAMPEP_0185833650 /NCGR_PEP_ID=MMETSP1353-20130828/3297_1 /TAXON_ID=1077150 /ORGANISM="Erythrolobus australicus, Strain CCMP3124" /LENGTH=769 /DNA_ID=CAMNT_0028531965 /DNA_START=285 /DNA_END=2595 /DNA_ORIENTATION=+